MTIQNNQTDGNIKRFAPIAAVLMLFVCQGSRSEVMVKTGEYRVSYCDIEVRRNEPQGTFDFEVTGNAPKTTSKFRIAINEGQLVGGLNECADTMSESKIDPNFSGRRDPHSSAP